MPLRMIAASGPTPRTLNCRSWHSLRASSLSAMMPACLPRLRSSRSNPSCTALALANVRALEFRGSKKKNSTPSTGIISRSFCSSSMSMTGTIRTLASDSRVSFAEDWLERLRGVVLAPLTIDRNWSAVSTPETRTPSAPRSNARLISSGLAPASRIRATVSLRAVARMCSRTSAQSKCPRAASITIQSKPRPAAMSLTAAASRVTHTPYTGSFARSLRRKPSNAAGFIPMPHFKENTNQQMSCRILSFKAAAVSISSGSRGGRRLQD